MKYSSICLSALLLGLCQTPALALQENAEAPAGGLTLNAPGAFQGYTLFSPLRREDVILVDMQGTEVHRWETQLPPGGGIYLKEDGNLLRCAREPDNPRFSGGGIGGRIQEFDWDGNLVWDYLMADDYQTQHHDIEPLPNGNLLVIVWEHRFAEDAIEFGRNPAALAEKGMWSTAILELKPILPDGAEVVWEWHLWDHLIQDFDPTKSNYGAVADHPGRLDINFDNRDQRPLSEEERKRIEEEEEQMQALGYTGDDEEEDEEADTPPAAGPQLNKSPDWMHVNAVDYNAELDLIVISSPRANEIFVIDHALSSDQAAGNRAGRWKKGGEFLYRWGNPFNYGAGEAEDQALFFQHDPTWLQTAKGPGLLVFNNGGGPRARGFSSADQLELPFDKARGFVREAGQAFQPKQPVWSYSNGEEFFSSFISGCQRLPNGNTLICAGAQGRLFEVTPAGEVVWDYTNPYTGEAEIGQGGSAPPVALFRGTRLALDHPGLKGRDL